MVEEKKRMYNSSCWCALNALFLVENVGVHKWHEYLNVTGTRLVKNFE